MSVSPPLTILSLSSSSGFSTMTVVMSAWNPQVYTGSLSLIGDLFRLGLVRGSYVPCKKSVFYGNIQGIAISLFPAVSMM